MISKIKYLKLIFLFLIILLSINQTVTQEDNSTWYITALNYRPNQISTFHRNNVTVALLDSGIDYNNSHLWKNPYEQANNIDDDNNGKIDDLYGWNFVNNTNNVTDLSGHGTLMASIITKLNTKVNIMSLKVMDRQDKLESLDFINNALEYAIQEQVSIIVIAIYFSSVTTKISSLISQAQAHNIAVITASGNYGKCSCNNGKTNALANLKDVLTIGAIDDNFIRASYSQYGKNLDLMAPGTITENNKTIFGTSVATGFAAGAFSLIDGIKTNSTFVTNLLERTATDLNIKNKDVYTGYGLINISLSLQVLLDKIPPKVQILGKKITITDNLGLYKIITPNQTIVIQDQNRSLNLQRLTTLSYNISVEDLAGNFVIFKINNNKQTDSINTISIMIILFVSGVKRKKSKQFKQ